MDFDLADLLGGIGTEVGLTNNSAHTLGMMKINYQLKNTSTPTSFNLKNCNFAGFQKRKTGL